MTKPVTDGKPSESSSRSGKAEATDDSPVTSRYHPYSYPQRGCAWHVQRIREYSAERCAVLNHTVPVVGGL